MSRRAETGNDFADRFLASRAFGQFRSIHWTTQREASFADNAASFTEFVFVERHIDLLQFTKKSEVLKPRICSAGCHPAVSPVENSPYAEDFFITK